jgi:hypothetical protein
MWLCGIPLDPDDVVWLADELRQRGFFETASKLLHADEKQKTRVKLTAEERSAVAGVLDNPPYRFQELRTALLTGEAAAAQAQRATPRPKRQRFPHHA